MPMPGPLVQAGPVRGLRSPDPGTDAVEVPLFGASIRHANPLGPTPAIAAGAGRGWRALYPNPEQSRAARVSDWFGRLTWLGLAISGVALLSIPVGQGAGRQVAESASAGTVVGMFVLFLIRLISAAIAWRGRRPATIALALSIVLWAIGASILASADPTRPAQLPGPGRGVLPRLLRPDGDLPAAGHGQPRPRPSQPDHGGGGRGDRGRRDLRGRGGAADSRLGPAQRPGLRRAAGPALSAARPAAGRGGAGRPRVAATVLVPAVAGGAGRLHPAGRRRQHLRLETGRWGLRLRAGALALLGPRTGPDRLRRLRATAAGRPRDRLPHRGPAVRRRPGRGRRPGLHPDQRGEHVPDRARRADPAGGRSAAGAGAARGPRRGRGVPAVADRRPDRPAEPAGAAGPGPGREHPGHPDGPAAARPRRLQGRQRHARARRRRSRAAADRAPAAPRGQPRGHGRPARRRRVRDHAPDRGRSVRDAGGRLGPRGGGRAGRGAGPHLHHGRLGRRGHQLQQPIPARICCAAPTSPCTRPRRREPDR